MSIRAWTAAGLATGAVVGVILVAVIIALAPDPRPSGGASTAAPTVPPAAPASGAPTGPVPATPAATRTSPAIGPRASTSIMHIGETAPVLALPQVGGGFVDLAALRGRPVWVVFVSSSCADCTTDLRLMADFVSRYSGDGLVGIVVDVEESESVAAAFARRSGITLPVGLDLDGHARAAWEVVGLPSHVWVDALQVVRDVAPASVGSDSMAESLALILPGVTVTP